MKAKSQRRLGLGALELIEEAVHMLRLAPGRTLAFYYLGAIPFTLGLLYFLTDMSRSAFAYERCASAAFGMSLLFVWMKTWQTVFARDLLARLGGGQHFQCSPAELARITLWQTIVQPSGLFLLPLAMVITIPVAWVHAFYQNVTVQGAGRVEGMRDLVRRSAAQAKLWPGQNHLALLVLSLFALLVFANLFMAVAQLPNLLKTFLGIETMFTRSLDSVLNTTSLMVTASLTYLCVDPLFKAVYVLRCFYGESLQSGADLKADLARVRATATAGVVALMLLAGNAGGAVPAPETDSGLPAAAPTVSAPALDHSIEKVLSERRYAWRLPREKADEPAGEKNVVGSFLDGVVDTIAGWFRSFRRGVRKVWDAIGDFLDWLDQKIRGKPKTGAEKTGRSGSGWMTSLQVLIFVLLALAASALAILFWRLWRNRQRQQVVVAEAVAAQPDLNDENVAADQLEEDGWIKLARELADQGNLRLALRALYLASLAHLAHREMISIAKFKSNREYERELKRRARALPDLQAAFGNNVAIFDRVWYGLHDVTTDAFASFQANLERMRGC